MRIGLRFGKRRGGKRGGPFERTRGERFAVERGAAVDQLGGQRGELLAGARAMRPPRT
jgi:hypothetical protein